MDTSTAIAAVAKIRGYVGTYLAHVGPLNATQVAALATDLKTLDIDLAALADSLAAPKTSLTAGVVDLSRLSSDGYWYMRQILELTKDPALSQKLAGSWPSEATDPQYQASSNAQRVGAYLANGPAYYPLSSYPALPNADVLLAFESAPLSTLNPVIAAALRAAATEARANPNGVVNFGTDTTPRFINVPNTSGTTWGQVAVSGRFGTVGVLGQ